MKLSDLIIKYPSFRQANLNDPKDNAKILEFYSTISMESRGFEIKFTREPDFLTFLNYQSDKYFVIVIENEDDKVVGLGSINFRPYQIDGKTHLIGYMSDLRVKANKRQREMWKNFVSDLIVHSEEIEEFGGCPFLVASIIDKNEKAMKAMTKLNHHYDMVPAWNYQMTSILSRKPFAALFRKPSNEYQIDHISSKKVLLDFLGRQQADQGFRQTMHSDGELQRRLQSWSNFSIDNFKAITNKKGEIVACFAPWSASDGRKLVINRMPQSLKLLLKVIKSLGKDLPAEGEEIKILYLTHLYLSKELSTKEKGKVMGAIIDNLYSDQEFNGYHMISFGEDLCQPLTQTAIKQKYFIQQTPTTLFQFIKKDRTSDYLLPTNGGVDFELALA
jgi:hypothetical protein